MAHRPGSRLRLWAAEAEGRLWGSCWLTPVRCSQTFASASATTLPADRIWSSLLGLRAVHD